MTDCYNFFCYLVVRLMVSSLYLDEIWIETFFLHRDLLHLEGAGDVELSNQPQEQRPRVTGQLFLNSGQE